MEETARDPLALPAPEVLRDIEAKQTAKAKEIQQRRKQQNPPDERNAAAALIQKNYRGYRTRRALQGFDINVDSSTRWAEVLKEAKYYNVTKPISRHERSSHSHSPDDAIRDRWRRIGTIAHRAGDDDTSSDSDVAVEDDEERMKLRERKKRQKVEREKYAKVMGLDYFLEMVDHKHRYGSNLRRYHVEWKNSSTSENFFYWLDFGEGKDIDLEDRPRSRLDTEYVRYLSPDERKQYLATIDKQGLFRWVKDNELVTTSLDFKDSINGIVSVEDETPTWREVTTGVKPEPAIAASDSSSLSGLSTGSQEDESKYVNEELHDAKGLNKLNHLSADAVKNHMLRKTTKKNTWIFVADTSFRLYIGIKQSGAFQHSSFLRGARVSAAGLIKVKRGQLRKLSPLSGHYSPPIKNFQEFMKSLKEAGADLSHLNTSRSYAVLLGLEGYLGAKRHVKFAGQGMKDMISPEEKRKREEAAKDNSKSAAREREILEQQQQRDRKRSLSYRLKRRLGLEDKDKKLPMESRNAPAA